MNPLLLHALRYASRGWRVFPLRGKVPMLAGSRGCLDATTHRGTICGWWEQHPTAGIGVHVGPGSGVWVLDVDAGTQGPEALASLERLHGALPGTAEVRTGGGGRHLYWRSPDRPIKNRVALRRDGERVHGLDVRSEGGYVVAPPSLHPDTGRPYEWVCDRNPVDAPVWLLDLVAPLEVAAPRVPYRPPPPSELDRGRRYAEAALRHACERIAGLADGRREALVRESYTIGGLVGAGVLSHSRAETELVAAGVASGTRHDVGRAVAHGLRTGAERPTAPPAPREPAPRARASECPPWDVPIEAYEWLDTGQRTR